MWWRPRMLGGRTNHWGRISLRMGPYDSSRRAATASGSTGLLNTRRWSRGTTRRRRSSASMATPRLGKYARFAERVAPAAATSRAHEMLIRKHSKKLGVPVIPVAHGDPHPAAEWPCCLLSTRRRVGAAVRSARTSNQRPCCCRPQWKRASRHHHRRHGARGHAGQVGQATGVLYINKETGKEERAAARGVVVAGRRVAARARVFC